MIALIGALLVAGVVPILSSAASAAPKLCPDGSPAPCEVVDPPTTVRTLPTTVPSTKPGPTTVPTTAPPHTLPPATIPPPVTLPPVTVPPSLPPITVDPNVPPLSAWNARINVLDQSAGGFNRNTSGGLVLDAWYGTFATPPGTVSWTDPAQTEGWLGLSNDYLPAPSPIGLRLIESGSSGRLCRSQPGPKPASGKTAHVLVAPAITRNPDQLAAMVSGFKGRVTPDPDGAEVTINSTSLVPQAGGLLLTLSGRIWKDIQWPLPNVDASFTYAVMLHLSPSTDVSNPGNVMRVTADVGDLDLEGDGWTDDLEIWAGDDVEPDFREAVVTKANAAVNANVASEPDAVWFRSLGFTISVRSVTTTAAGITVLPSICKLS